jgi:hypothetical protein
MHVNIHTHSSLFAEVRLLFIHFPHRVLLLTPWHGLINYVDTKAKCRHLKKLTCKGTLRQVFIKVS